MRTQNAKTRTKVFRSKLLHYLEYFIGVSALHYVSEHENMVLRARDSMYAVVCLRKNDVVLTAWFIATRQLELTL